MRLRCSHVDSVLRVVSRIPIWQNGLGKFGWYVMRLENVESTAERNGFHIGATPEEIDETARKHTRGRFAICAIYGVNESDQPLREGFKALNYRLGGTEPIMVHALKRIPPFEEPAKIVRVTTADLADRVNKAARARQILSEHLVKRFAIASIRRASR